MKTFKGTKSLEVIVNDGEAIGWIVDTTAYYESDSDFIYLIDMDVRLKQVAVNVFNGHFFVYEPFQDTPTASHLSKEFDDVEWYKEILNLIYNK